MIRCRRDLVPQFRLVLTGMPGTVTCGSFTVTFDVDFSTPPARVPVVPPSCTDSISAFTGTDRRTVNLPVVGSSRRSPAGPPVEPVCRREAQLCTRPARPNAEHSAGLAVVTGKRIPDPLLTCA